MAPKMVQLLHAITLFAVLATTTADLAAYNVVSSEKCEPACGLGQACTEHEVVCCCAPCNPEHVCASRAQPNQTNPCNPEVCPKGSSCIPASRDDDTPIAVCAPPCWVKTCNHDQTCVMKAGTDGYKEATCVPIKSECYPAPTTTCDHVRCGDSTCKMIDCEPQCIPLV